MSDASKETEQVDNPTKEDCKKDHVDNNSALGDKPSQELMETQSGESGDLEKSQLQETATSATEEHSSCGREASTDQITDEKSTAKEAAAGAEAAPSESEAGVEPAASEMDVGLDAEVELVSFKVVFNKKKYDVTLPVDSSISDLKKYLEPETNVSPAMQKIMIKGPAKDSQTLKELKVTSSTKCMMIGSTAEAVKSVASPSKETIRSVRQAAKVKEPLSKQKMHARVIEKYGKPEDVVVGVKGRNDSLPTVPLAGMINKTGGKVRLTFKMELDQLWIGTKDRTNKVPMSSVKQIISEPIQGEEEYHIMGLQLGPTDLSCYWIYYVPAQYVNAVKDTILGKWQPF